MKIVNIIVDSSRIVDYLVAPIRKNKNLLKGRGYKIKFYSSIKKEALICDVLLLVSKAVFGIVEEKDIIIKEGSPTLKLISKARKYADKIIWMDNSDSTSVTHFELLPFVDLYLKKQLFKDKTLYQKDFIGGRIFTDYYHHHFGITDDSKFKQFYPLDTKLADKVDLSWNIGLGNMYNPFTNKEKLRLKFPKIIPSSHNIEYTTPHFKKDIDLFIRTTSNLDRNLIAFHRKELLKRLNKIIEVHSLSGSTSGPWLTTNDYREILQRSKILPSPFGWGELGVRDYEAFIYGALLLKPDMSHMDTWPPIFIENETYVPFKWNFSDLDDKIVYYLKNNKTRIEIAKNGQKLYKKSISKEGMDAFCEWFINQIEK